MYDRLFAHVVAWVTYLQLAAFWGVIYLGDAAFGINYESVTTATQLLALPIAAVATSVAFLITPSPLLRGSLLALAATVVAIWMQLHLGRLSIMQTAWYVAIGIVNGAIIYLDRFSYFQDAIVHLRVCPREEQERLAERIHRDAAWVIERLNQAILAIVATLGVMMSILFAQPLDPNATLEIAEQFRVLRGIVVVVMFALVLASIFFWLAKPVWTYLAELRPYRYLRSANAQDD